jgi:LmbE family N-acetylglucosaminyl deacetylase
MEQLNIEKGQRALVIVAHPDDETIWMGGAIKIFKGAQWTILCLCRQSDPDRAPKFFKVCRSLGAKAIMADLEDEGKLSIQASIPKIKKIILENTASQNFDLVFTHGSNGEYGHPRHKSTHLAVVDLYKRGKLRAEKLLFFNYQKISALEFSPLRPKKNCDYILELNQRQFKAKLDLMTEIYGFDRKGIDASYCTNPEGFKLLVI